MFFSDAALLIDILPHSGDSLLFAREDLIRVVAKNWPSVVEPYRVRGTVIPERALDDNDRKKHRKAGLEALLVIHGQPYFSPGHGVTSASTPGKVTDAMFRLRRNVRSLAQQVLEPEGEFLARVDDERRRECHFSLLLCPQGVVVYERSTDQGWTLPDAKLDGTDSYFAEISDALSPPWARQSFQEALVRATADLSS